MKVLLIVFTLLFTFRSFANSFCHEKLNEEITKLLKEEDSKLLSKMYELSQLKVIHKMTLDKSRRSTLESFISKKLKEINPKKKAALEMKISELYKTYGKKISQDEASKILEDIEDSEYHRSQNRIQGTGNAVIALLLQNIDDGCAREESLSCIEDSDISVLWLMGEMRDKVKDTSGVHKNLMDTSVIAANYSGYANEEIFLTSNESAQALAKITKEIEKDLEKLESDFYQKYTECLQTLGEGACFKKQAKLSIQDKVQDLLAAITGGELPKLNKKNHEILLDGITLKYGLNNSYNIKAKVAKEKEEDNRKEKIAIEKLKSKSSNDSFYPSIGMCGGKEFHKEMRNMKTYGLSDIKGGFSGTKDAVKDYKSGGRSSLVEKNNESDKLKLASKFAIQGPMFRCSPELVKKIPKVAFKTAEQRVCCQEEKEWRNLYYFFMNYSGGFSCRGFLGLPYIAEVGVKVGAGINLKVGGGLEPRDCNDKACFQGAVAFNVSAAIYAEALAGFGSLQGTISWIPYASLKQCLSTQSQKLPPAQFSYKVGNILLIGTARVGWTISYDVVKPIYQDEKTTTTDIAIF